MAHFIDLSEIADQIIFQGNCFLVFRVLQDMTAQGRVSYMLEITSLSTFGRSKQALSAK